MSISDNERLQGFLRKLQDEKVHARLLWETRRDGRPISRTKPADVFAVSLYGDGFSPSVGVIILLDYGKNGFGTFTDSLPNEIKALVRTIVKPREG